MNRFYSVLVLDYYGNAFNEWWKINGGGFEGALEEAFKKLECDDMVKEMFFWNEAEDRPFAYVYRCGWTRCKDIPEYYVEVEED